MGLSHSSHYSHVSHVRSVATFNEKVIISPYEDIYPRRDLFDFYGNETYRPQFDLLIQGYQALKDRPYEDMRSYYQVSGIHGLPYTAYDGVTGSDPYKSSEISEGRWGGYCQHGSALFPTWHRPYMFLFENLLINEVKQIALQYPSNQRNKYIEAAKQLRHPYWDWADEKAAKGVPDIFLTPTIEINTPKGKKNVSNPLRNYILPTNLSIPLQKGQNPTDKPNYHIPNMTYNPYTPKGYTTIRHPNSNYEDQYDLLNQNFSIYVPSVLRPALYQMYHISNYLHFSNHIVTSSDHEMPESDPGHPEPDPKLNVGSAHFASIETAHDGLHLIAGGLGGHMTYVDITAFDPLFYFHHINCDRLFALWQGVFPDSWVPQNINGNGTYTEGMNYVVNEYTDLEPFRKSETEFWRSSDVRDITKLGYTYLELEKFRGKDPNVLQNYLLELYKPDPHYGTRFFVKVTIERGKLVGPYAIRVFVDLPSANAATPVTSPHFAGFVAMWQSTLKHKKNSFVVGTVDITAAMVRLGIRTEQHGYLHDVNSTTGLLKPTSLFNIGTDINIVPVMMNGYEVSPKDAGVTLVQVFSFEHDKVDKNFLVESSGEFLSFKKF
ncbi:13519_t:CDS:2 [Dentiscutata erythropus]|uniref:tyrosinase n=1 Tax=Dentiscutata erythropus TaxID=1348616 RepID=A0A9N9P213_9GLOM|nr:13519_t:CDS:2 [Dentiscutata erythropus]